MRDGFSVVLWCGVTLGLRDGGCGMENRGARRESFGGGLEGGGEATLAMESEGRECGFEGDGVWILTFFMGL